MTVLGLSSPRGVSVICQVRLRCGSVIYRVDPRWVSDINRGSFQLISAICRSKIPISNIVRNDNVNFLSRLLEISYVLDLWSSQSRKDISVSASTYLGLGIFELTREIPCLSLGNFKSTREIPYLGLGNFKSTRPRNALSISTSRYLGLGIFFLLYFQCRQIAFLTYT
jgi:hypothetical protein